MKTFNELNQPRQNATGYEIPMAPMVPSNGLSDGIAPAGKFQVAKYLPTIRYNESKYTYVVIASGKPVAQDSTGAVVPAGLRLDLAAYKSDPASALVKYTERDVTAGVRNAKGELAKAGEAVVASFEDAGITIGSHFGVAQYDCFVHAGGDGISPGLTTYINFNIQPVISIMADYHQQYPVVATVEELRAAALKGISAMVAKKADVKFGGFVTYDAESNFVMDSKPSFETTVGQVTGLRVYKDDTTGKVVGTHNDLHRVVAPNAATASALNQVASVQNEGMGSFITYSNGWGVVEFNLINR